MLSVPKERVVWQSICSQCQIRNWEARWPDTGLSGHKLMIETGRHRQTWLPPEQRLCSHCDLNQMETELHFLTECSKYTDIQTVYYDKIQQIHPTFTTLPDQEKLAYLLGEHKTCCVLAAQYVSLSPQKRRHSTCVCWVCVWERPAVCLLLNMCLSVTTEEKTLRLPWADVSSTCRLYYDILPPFILLKCIFCLYKPYTYFI